MSCGTEYRASLRPRCIFLSTDKINIAFQMSLLFTSLSAISFIHTEIMYTTNNDIEQRGNGESEKERNTPGYMRIQKLPQCSLPAVLESQHRICLLT